MSAKKTLRIRQIRSSVGCPPEVRAKLKALGLGRKNQVSEKPNTVTVRRLIMHVAHFVEYSGGFEVLFPREPSKLGNERIRRAVEEVVASRK